MRAGDIEIVNPAVLSAESAEAVRRLSFEIMAMAQGLAGIHGLLSEENWQRLIDGGLLLRRLANLPPPWGED